MKQFGTKALWATAFLSACGIASANEFDPDKHHNKLSGFLSQKHGEAYFALGDLISRAKSEKKETVFSFQHVDADTECLCAMCNGEEEAELIRRMYEHYGVEIEFTQEGVTITV
jgi:hypothetical protein